MPVDIFVDVCLKLLNYLLAVSVVDLLARLLGGSQRRVSAGGAVNKLTKALRVR